MKTMQKYLFLFFLITFLCIFTQEKICYAQNSKTQEQIELNHAENKHENKLSIASPQVSAANEESKQNVSSLNNAKSSAVSTLPKEEVPAFTWKNYFKAIGIMLLLLVLFGYVLKVIKKYGTGRFLPSQKLLPRDSMYLEGQLPLGQGKSIVIVRVLNERLILGITEKNINLLTKTGINHAETFEELIQQAHMQNNTNA